MNRLCKLILLVACSISVKAQVPTATIVVPGSTLCSGYVHTFTTVTSNSPTAFSWSVSPASGVTITPDRTSDFIQLSFSRGGTYLLSLAVSNSASTTVVTRTVGITQTAHASFNASLNATGFPNQMILTNYSTHQTSNAWLYNDAPADNNFNTVKDYTTSGAYSITLISFGASACNDTLAYDFRIEDSSGITLPNIFTPNNDSINDVFRPIARGITKMNAYIYNRYGTLIYNWDKVHGFWDGYNTSGEPCSPGIYYCVLEATGFDGKSYKLKTHITLLR